MIRTDEGHSDGLDKCPRCGSTEISLRPATGKLICHFCRFEWSAKGIDELHGLSEGIAQLQGTQVASGAAAIQESTQDVVTLHCAACGADVIVNTAESTQSRCHWCRNTLSINQQIPNGAVPDGLLPFTVTREQAVESISEFVGKRRFFAHPTFVRQFRPSEVVGVYLPYLLVDGNVHVEYAGTGEIETGRRQVGDDNHRRTIYDADVYRLERGFDLHVDDLAIESSAQRANQDVRQNTNNVINAILPFDVKAAVAYNSNYLRGFTSERRDLDVAALKPLAGERFLSIGRSQAGAQSRQYDRGVRWEQETVWVHGTRWVALYLPVWLYSYHEERDGTHFIHYVAVNGRTRKTIGSVPVRFGRLISISAAIGIVGTAIGAALAFLTA